MQARQLLITVIAALGALAWSAATPSTAAAQACCTATGAGEYSVVGRCQQSAIGLDLSYTRAIGTYTEDGDYEPLNSADVNDVTLGLGGGTRIFHDSLQVYGSVPLRLQHRGLQGAGSTTSVGFGDVAAALRWTALEDIMEGADIKDAKTLMPFVDIYAGSKAPTGRAPDATRVSTGSDIMGDGSWKVFGGLKLAKFVTSKHVAGISGQYSYAFAHEVAHGDSSTMIRPGPTWTAGASYLFIPNVFWSAGLSSTYEYSQPMFDGGSAVDDSNSRRLSFGAHVTHGFGFPYWEATLGVNMDAWWNHGGQNIPFTGPSVALTIRRHWM